MKGKMRALFFLCLSFLFKAAWASSPILMFMGTRPEAIKLFPCYQALKAEGLDVYLCSSGQHRDLLTPLFDVFDMQPDVEFNIMKEGQDLFYITEKVLEEAKALILVVKPSLVIVQGDTTTAFAAALASFYLKVPVAHVEAGLRTHDAHCPFPEEMNRRVISKIASYHFAPTPLAVKNLRNEGVDTKRIFCTGNTVVDALYFVQRKLAKGELKPSAALKSQVEAVLSKKGRLVLLTAHRRESHHKGLSTIYSAIEQALSENPVLHVIYPMHPNPAVCTAFKQSNLKTHPRFLLMPPLSYADMVYLYGKVVGVMTDSGGVQEEAVSLSLSTLVLRKDSGRPEGDFTIVGWDEDKICRGVQRMLGKRESTASLPPSPFGNGDAGLRIAREIKRLLR